METLTEVLLLHEGELSDVAALLDELGATWAQGRAAWCIEGSPGLVLGTPQHLLRWRGDASAATRVAVCAGGGRTLDRKLEAEGVDFIVRRPIHPAALRLLLLHLVYRGPERRRLRRVSAAVPIRFRTGLWPRTGLLLEFSVGGCQLLTDSELPAGQAIRLSLPSDLGLGRKLKIRGRVRRSQPAPAGGEGEFVVAVDFGDLAPETRQRLAAAVVARALPTSLPRPAASAASAAPRPEPSETAPLACEPSDRRQQPRGAYTKPVHGRLDEAQIVLMGTNLSPEGMRVDPEPRLELGMRVTLDLYGHGDIPPLRLEAEVARDDGERGLFLEFQDLWPGAPALLERLVKTLPVIAPGHDESVVVTEVVDRA